MRNLVVNEQQYRIRGGSQAPTFKLAKDLTTMDGGRLLLSTPVKRIVYGDGDPRLRDEYPVLVEGEDALSRRLVQVRAKHVIITGAPPTTGRGIAYSPPLPFEKNQLFQRMPMGNSVKAQIVYERAFWRDLGYTGTILASTPPFGNAQKPLLSNCFDNSPYSKSFGVLLCFVEGETSIEVMRLTHQERLDMISGWLVKSFGEEAIKENAILNFLDFNWAAQNYIGGAYSSFMTTGAWTQYGRNLRSSVQDRLHWAGADYAEDGFGYINGAIQSAGKVAAHVANRLSAGARAEA
jgi:monoamine oxidase